MERLKRDLESAVDGWSTEQLLWHLPQKWCAAEVLEHLLLTYSGTVKGFERVVAAGRPLATKASVWQSALTFMVVRLRHIPSGFEAPTMVRPKGLPVAVVRSEIGPTLAAMDAIIAHCEDRFGRSVKLLDHPILGPLTARSWRTLHVVHGGHHRKQLLRLGEAIARDHA